MARRYVVIGTSPLVDTSVVVGSMTRFTIADRVAKDMEHLGYVTEICPLLNLAAARRRAEGVRALLVGLLLRRGCAMNDRRDRDRAVVRALVEHFDDATLLAVEKALRAQAAVLDVVASAVPEQRADAARLRDVAPLFTRAVTTRDWIEEVAITARRQSRPDVVGPA